MALRGTLDDFGLTHVLQLIGQNGRHGVLTIQHRAEQINLFFADGQLVRTEGTGHSREELLGSHMLRADLLSHAQLTWALERRAKSGERLGDVLVDAGLTDAGTLAAFSQLHSAETAQRALGWLLGTYAFLPSDSAPAAAHAPIRCEALLMQAAQQADAWPQLRRRVPHYSLSFSVRRSLEDYLATATMGDATRLRGEGSELDFGLADPGGPGAEGEGGGGERIGHSERHIFGLIEPARDVQRLIDLSRLGEFETVRALVVLMDEGLIAQAAGTMRRPTTSDTLVRPVRLRQRFVALWATQGGRMALALLALGVALASGRPPEHWPRLPGERFVPAPLTRLMWQSRAAGIAAAIEREAARAGLPASAISLEQLRDATGDAVLAPGAQLRRVPPG